MSGLRNKTTTPMGLNPAQVKRRETLGVLTLLLAMALLVAGLLTCTSNWLTGILLLGSSVGLGSMGARALQSIPDLLASPDESF